MLGVERLQEGAQQSIHQRVGHQIAAIEVGRDGAAQRGARLDLGPQPLPGRDRHKAQLVDQRLGDRALARAGRAEQNDIQWLCRHTFSFRRPVMSPHNDRGYYTAAPPLMHRAAIA